MQKELSKYIFLHILCCLFMVSAGIPLAAQDHDVIYLVDETPVKSNLVEITPKKVKYESQSGKVRTYDAVEVLVVFNKAGNYLIFPPLQITPEASNDFIHSGNKPPYDILVTLDKQVIPASIISADEKEVMYQDVRQQSGERSIGKDILAVIIFKNGQHELLVSPSQATEILSAVNGQIKQLKDQTSTPVTTENKPVVKAETDVAKKQVTTIVSGNSAGAVDQNKAEGSPKAEGKKKAEADPATNAQSLTLLKEAALKKVKDLSEYIRIISDVQISREKAKTTIDLACALFVDEDARIEVSDLMTGVKNKYKIKDYLNRLAMRAGQYKKIDIDYANINYATDFVKRPDGKYDGETRYMQTFKGFSNGNIMYGEMTKRKAAVMQKLDKKEEAISRQSWDVFLSDIGVVETQKSN